MALRPLWIFGCLPVLDTLVVCKLLRKVTDKETMVDLFGTVYSVEGRIARSFHKIVKTVQIIAVLSFMYHAKTEGLLSQSLGYRKTTNLNTQ